MSIFKKRAAEPSLQVGDRGYVSFGYQMQAFTVVAVGPPVVVQLGSLNVFLSLKGREFVRSREEDS